MCTVCACSKAQLSRRDLSVGLFGLAFFASIARPSLADDTKQGCWLRAASDSGGPGEMLLSSGDLDIDAFCENERRQLNKLFGVAPALRYFSGDDSNNAFATQDIVESDKPVGTVLIGIRLAAELTEKYKRSSAMPLAAVMAHEWGHIVQYTRSFKPEWEVEYELRADAGAGWYLLKTRGHKALVPHSEELGGFFAALGNRRFNNFRFHGTPTQRKNELLDSAHLLGTDIPLSDRESKTAAEALGIEVGE